MQRKQNFEIMVTKKLTLHTMLLLCKVMLIRLRNAEKQRQIEIMNLHVISTLTYILSNIFNKKKKNLQI